MKTLLLCGGTFDPVHRFHVEGPRAVQRLLYPQRSMLVFIPAARNPLKDLRPGASDVDRLAMLGLALGGEAGSAVWTDEIDRAAWAEARGRGGASYTVDTLRRLRKQVRKQVELRLLIGADQAVQFHRWREPRVIMRLAPPLVMLRGDVSTPAHFAEALRKSRVWSDEEIRGWCASIAPSPVVALSATIVRTTLARGGGSRMKDTLHPAVFAYIKQRGLYRGSRGLASVPGAATRGA